MEDGPAVGSRPREDIETFSSCHTTEGKDPNCENSTGKGRRNTPLAINAGHNDTQELGAERTGDLHIVSFGHAAVESFCLENVRR